MIDPTLSEIILAGLTVLGGGGGLVAAKKGYLSLGKNGNNGAVHKEQHNKIDEALAIFGKVLDKQILIAENHEKRLDDGNEDFRQMRDEIGQVKSKVSFLEGKLDA